VPLGGQPSVASATVGEEPGEEGRALVSPDPGHDGELVVAAGEVAPDFPMLATMNFYVQGIDDKLPE